LHTIKTKRINRNRIKSHSKKNVEEWFEKYKITLLKLDIYNREDIHNINESRARVGCLRGEEVVVLIKIKELYTLSLKNRKSVTIIEAISADRRKLPPPLVICLRKKIIELCISKNLEKGTKIEISNTG
jgi:hypothetical protein